MTGAVEDWQSWRRLKNVLVEPLDMGPIGMKLQQRTTAFVSAAKSSMDAAKSSVDAALSSMEQRMDSVFENALSTGMNGLSKPSISNLINIDSLEETTDSLHSQFEQIEGGEGWAEVRSSYGITVWKKKGDRRSKRGRSGVEDRLYIVKAQGTIGAPPKQVYDIFMDNNRIHEYNKLCNGVQDLEVVNGETKITWSCSRSIGPFKPRDFVTLIHTKRKRCGSYLVLNRAVRSKAARPRRGFVRGEILLAGHLFGTVPGDPNSTSFMTLMQVNPGGVAEMPLGTRIINRLCTNGPLNFIRNLERLAQGKPALARTM
uniref:START domain-containing protein n=1 Tax=Rhodosorus marinus TaxID=101924 RepID=A0A7S2ZJH5_9RHOD|mmetsp:Transcript_20644/g.83820  ORF Transcript_20644/g.83820 Transcript_20644/m.83820 type:complete len:315 (+) Transcript_20644:290-1234(+)